MFGADSSGELAFVVLLAAVVLLAQVVPKVGEAIGGLFERSSDKRPDRDPPS